MVLKEKNIIYVLYDGLEGKKIIYVHKIVLKGTFLYVIRMFIFIYVVTLWCKQISDCLTQKLNSGIGYLLLCVTYVWNWHVNSIFQVKQVFHKSFASVCYQRLHFCLHNYPLTAYYVPYSCHCPYLLKYNINNYCNIWPNQHSPMDPFILLKLHGLHKALNHAFITALMHYFCLQHPHTYKYVDPWPVESVVCMLKNWALAGKTVTLIAHFMAKYSHSTLSYINNQEDLFTVYWAF